VPEEKTPFQLYILQCDAMGKADTNIESMQRRYRDIAQFDYVHTDVTIPLARALKTDLLAWFPQSTAIICLKELGSLTAIQNAVQRSYGRVPEYFVNHEKELKLAYDLTRATTYTGYFRRMYEIDQTPVPLTMQEARCLTIKKMLLG
jgi:hypothetical protein